MKKSVVSLILIYIVLCAARAYAQSPAEKTAETVATVYVYRYKQFMGSGLEPSVYCDEAELARMDNGRYFAVKLAPGKHTFRSNDKQAGIEMELKGGETYYIRVELVPGMMKGHGRLVLMQKEQGAYEIRKLKPLGDDKVRDKTKVVTTEKSTDKP